ncbi:hypothetical protein SDC9_175560 [bioreactor metagenome]|uniref:Uncharacterized protein n=1 Tax=bioreactor metagenome TaxID=1076179 RepID=A0A645GMF4_9ZZZZ
MRDCQHTGRRITAKPGDHIPVGHADNPPEHRRWNQWDRIMQHLPPQGRIGMRKIDIAFQLSHNKQKEYRNDVGGDNRDDIAV